MIIFEYFDGNNSWYNLYDEFGELSNTTAKKDIDCMNDMFIINNHMVNKDALKRFFGLNYKEISEILF